MFWLLNRIIKEEENVNREDEVVQEPLEKLIMGKLAWHDLAEDEFSDDQY